MVKRWIREVPVRLVGIWSGEFHFAVYRLLKHAW